MFIRSILVILILSGACRSGEIPCPESKKIKLHKSGINRITSKKDSSPERSKSPHAKDEARKPSSSVSTKNINIDDWDCPRPGSNKVFLPKSIKNNIRRNSKEINTVAKKGATSDSLRMRPDHRSR